jgi:flagellar biosynthesis protein FlhF
LPALLDKVTDTTTRALSPAALQDPTRVTWQVQQQLEAVLLTETETAFARRRLVCLIGTTGAGKTPMAARLAARFTQLRGRSVAWICADTVRAGAIAQARAYAETLKLPLRVVYTPAELAQAVAAESHADLVLVDLPGCNPRREEAVVELGGYLAALPERATYWVAAATAKDADLADTLAAFHPFRLSGLIVTKLDETRTYGSVYNLAWQSRLPLAFFTASPRVLDELSPAQPEHLAEALLESTFRP